MYTRYMLVYVFVLAVSLLVVAVGRGQTIPQVNRNYLPVIQHSVPTPDCVVEYIVQNRTHLDAIASYHHVTIDYLLTINNVLTVDELMTLGLIIAPCLPPTPTRTSTPTITPTPTSTPTSTPTFTPSPTSTPTMVSPRPLQEVVIRGADVPVDWEITVDAYVAWQNAPEAYTAFYRTPWNNNRISQAQFTAVTFLSPEDARASAVSRCHDLGERPPTLPGIGDYSCFAVNNRSGYLFTVKSKTILLTVFHFVDLADFDQDIFRQCNERMMARLEFREIGGCNMHDYD